MFRLMNVIRSLTACDEWNGDASRLQEEYLRLRDQHRDTDTPGLGDMSNIDPLDEQDWHIEYCTARFAPTGMPNIQLLLKSAAEARKKYLQSPEDGTNRQDLADSLLQLGTTLDDQEDFEGAESALSESVELKRTVWSRDPSKNHGDLLATSLRRLSQYYGRHERWPEAREEIKEEVELHRASYEQDPDIGNCTKLACSLDSLTLVCCNLGQWPDALSFAEEAIILHRVVSLEDPETTRPHLACSLYNMSIALFNLQWLAAARDVIADSVCLRRILYSQDSAASIEALACSQYVMAVCSAQLECWDDARAAAIDAVDLFQVLHAQDPEEFHAVLADSLHQLGSCDLHFNDWSNAMEVFTKAVEIRRILHSRDPDPNMGDLAHSLHHLAISMINLGQWDIASDILTESIAIYRVLHLHAPLQHVEHLAMCLGRLASMSFQLGNHERASDAEMEFIPLCSAFYYQVSEADRVSATQILDALAAEISRHGKDTPVRPVSPAPQEREATTLTVPRSVKHGSRSCPAAVSHPPQLPRLSTRKSEEKVAFCPISLKDIKYSEPTSPSALSPVSPVTLKNSCIYPPSPPVLSADLFLISWNARPVANGGYANVFRGEFCGRPVALKQLKPHEKDGKIIKRFSRESEIWRRQNHVNILNFIGTYIDNTDPREPMYMVSPWQNNGNLIEFLRAVPYADRLSLIIGIAEGLAYLHSQQPSIIHGDLRGANVVISDDHTPCLTDFGLSTVVNDVTQEHPDFLSMDTTTANRGGSVRWLAPELLTLTETDDIDSASRPPLTMETDVYSYAMIIIEAFTGLRPFNHINTDMAVIVSVCNGRRPAKPGHDAYERGFTEAIWDVTQQCWQQCPETRPLATEIVPALRAASSAR